MSDEELVELSLKPMLTACIHQALFLALVDVAMWSGEVEAHELLPSNLGDLGIGHQWKLLPGIEWVRSAAKFVTGAPIVTDGPAELGKLAEGEGIELMTFEERAARGGWIEAATDTMLPGRVSFKLDGDDRWWFHLPGDYKVRVERYPTDAEREAWRNDVYLIPSSDFDPVALAQNLARRLFGLGGAMLPGPEGGYTPNMSWREVFEATFIRPDRNMLKETAAAITGQVEPEANDGV